MPVQIRKLKKEELTLELFAPFDRSQYCPRQWQKQKNGQWELISSCMTQENWSLQQRQFLLECLKNTLETGGLVLGALDGEQLIAFGSVERVSPDKAGDLLELTSLHVSREHRRQGLGKELFFRCGAWAVNHGAQKLLIGANPAEETIAFYRGLGCQDSQGEEGSFLASKEDMPLICPLPPVLLQEVSEGKKRWLELLLLGDEQESMIDRYLERGRMYLLWWNEKVRTCAVVTQEGEGIFELKNLATNPEDQGLGFGQEMICRLLRLYQGKGEAMLVGTGDSPLTVPFYERCGFVFSHRVKDFFIRHYDHPIIEDGVVLRDMVYLRRPLK